MPPSWASVATAKKPEPPPPVASKPAAEVVKPATSPTRNGAPAEKPPAPAPLVNGDVAAAAPSAARPPATFAPAVAEKKQPAQAAHSYEPAPNEILKVTLNKPTAETKLGIRLSGTERPYIKSLNADGLAAKAGCLQEHDVFLKVNGHPAVGHEKTTAQLRTATGKILIELYRVQIKEE
ncbi:hypothetical protein Ctob_012050, partial [Chrysochromulina tobinii]